MEKFPKMERHSDAKVPTEKKESIFRLGVSPVEANFRIGPMRSHLYNYIYAGSEKLRNKDTKIYFRVDDSNQEKGDKEIASRLFSFFSESLGMHFDTVEVTGEQMLFQSQRTDLYKEYLSHLFDLDVVFVDKESGLTLFDIERFIEDHGDEVKFHDVVRGEIVFKLKKLLETQRYFPVVRSDGSVLYHLASVADDHDLGVTHVVRGVDKLSIAQYQEMIRIALDLEPKEFMHTPLMLDGEGALLKGDVLYDSFLRKGILPQAMMSYMVSSGYGNPDEVYESIMEIVEKFDYRKVRQNNGKFDFKKLLSINRKILSGISSEDYEISARLFIAKIHREDIQKSMNEDAELLTLLGTLKVPFEKLSPFYDAFLHPDYSAAETLEPSVLIEMRMLLEMFKNGSFHPIDSLQSMNKDKMRALKFILIGEHTMSGGLIEMTNYLQLKGLIFERVRILEGLL